MSGARSYLHMAFRLSSPIVILFSLVVAVPSQTKQGTFVTIHHPAYPISVSIPPQWSAEVRRDRIIPIDTWILSPAGVDLFDQSVPRVVLLIDWLPKKARQSAFFPGDLVSKPRKVQVNFAGQQIIATEQHSSNDGTTQLLADVERYGLFIGVRTLTKTNSDELLVSSILGNIQIEPAKSRPNFTGTWRIFAARDASTTLIIAHRDSTLRVTEQRFAHGRTSVTESIYYLDGKQHITREIHYVKSDDKLITPREYRRVKSVVRWQTNRLVIRRDTEDEQEWELTGERLNITTGTTKLVYQKSAL